MVIKYYHIVLDVELNYHKMKVADLNKSVADFEWQAFFDAAGAKGDSGFLGLLNRIADGS